MTADAPDTEAFMALVARLAARDPRLSELGAAMLVAAQLGLASDTRSFAKTFGIAHALVLRELNAMAQLPGLVEIARRDPRTMRTHYIVAAATAVRLEEPLPAPAAAA